MMRLIRVATIVGLMATTMSLGGCVVAGLVSAMGQSNEYQKLIEVPAQYPDLVNRTVAIVVEADLSLHYQHPGVVANVMAGVWGRLVRDVPGIKVRSPKEVLAWQYSTPQWFALPYGEWAEQLDVDRVVHIEIYEYRLHPPGNSWIWEGACMANVSIIERDSIDPDGFAESFHVASEYPKVQGLGRESATEGQIEAGVLSQFIQRAAWLFHLHEEPKYPDKYRPELG
jgi:hypothetical protein